MPFKALRFSFFFFLILFSSCKEIWEIKSLSIFLLNFFFERPTLRLYRKCKWAFRIWPIRDVKVRQTKENRPTTENSSFTVSGSADPCLPELFLCLEKGKPQEASGFYAKQPFQQRQLTWLKTGQIKILHELNHTVMDYIPFMYDQKLLWWVH